MRKAGLIISSLVVTCLWCASMAAEGTTETVTRVVEWEMKLRVFEGVKEGLAPAPSVVTASFLKYSFSANFRSDEESTEEQAQIRRIFNLKDVKLLTEGDLNWKAGMPAKVPFVFRLDGREYSINVRGGDLVTQEGSVGTQTFGIEVFERTKNDAAEKIEGVRSPIISMKTASLLDTEFTVSSLKNVTVFGFEDSQGRPYFISLQQTGMYAEEPVAAAVTEGVIGGVAGGVLGGVEGKEVAQNITPPRLVKTVEPVYPDEARRARIEGTVVVEARVDVNGKVIDAKVLKSIPGLDQAAVDAVKQWVYEPMIINGVKRPIVFTTTVRFSLSDEGATPAGGIKPPKLVTCVNPVYPEIARQAQVEGTVILEATTDEKGNVESVKILRSIPVLDQAAVDAVRQWKYEPMIIDGKPRKVVFTVTVLFKLNPSEKEKAYLKFAQGAVRAEGEIKPPKPLKVVDPVYPAEAKKAGVEGTVILAVKTDAAGKVQDTMILRSIPALNQAAIDAVKQWVYEPLIVNGIPRPVVFTVTVFFQNPDKDKTKKIA
jgi:TonB family protein